MIPSRTSPQFYISNASYINHSSEVGQDRHSSALGRLKPNPVTPTRLVKQTQAMTPTLSLQQYPQQLLHQQKQKQAAQQSQIQQLQMQPPFRKPQSTMQLYSQPNGTGDGLTKSQSQTRHSHRLPPAPLKTQINDESLVEHSLKNNKRVSNILDQSINKNNVSEVSHIEQDLNTKLERKITKLIEENNRLNEIISKNFKDAHSKINLETDNYQLNQIVKQLSSQLEEKDKVIVALENKIQPQDYQDKVAQLEETHHSTLKQQQAYEEQIMKKLNEMIDENSNLCQIIEKQSATINQQQVSLQKQSLVESQQVQKYQALRSQMDSSSQSRIDQLHAQYAEQIQEYTQMVAQYNQQLASLEEQKQNEVSRRNDLQQELKNAQQNILRLTQQHQLGLSQSQQLGEKREEQLRDEVQQIQHQLHEERTNNEKQQQEIHLLYQDNTRLQDSLKKIQKAKAEQDHKLAAQIDCNHTQAQNILDLEQSLQALHTEQALQREDKEREWDQLKDEVDRMESRLKGEQAQMEARIKEQDQMKEEYEQIIVEQRQEAQHLQHSLAAQQEQCRNQEYQQQQQDEQIEKYQQSLQDKEEQYLILQNKLQSQSTQIQQYEQSLKDKENQCESLQAIQSDQQNSLIQTQDLVKGYRLQVEQLQVHQAASEIAQELKTQLEVLQEENRVQNEQMQSIQMELAEQNALMQQREQERKREVHEKQEEINKQEHFIKEIQEEMETIHVQSIERERALEEKLARAKEQSQDKEQKIQQQEREMEWKNQQMDELNGEVERLKSARHQERDTQLNLLEQQLGELREERDRQWQHYENTITQLKETHAQEKQQEKLQREQDQAHHQEQLLQKQQLIDQLEVLQKEQLLQHEQMQSEIEIKQKEIKELHIAKTEQDYANEMKIESLQQQIIKGQQQLHDQSQQNKDYEQQLKKEIGQKEQQLRELHDQMDQIATQYKNKEIHLEQQIEQYMVDLQTQAEQGIRAQEALIQAQKQYNDIQDQMVAKEKQSRQTEEVLRAELVAAQQNQPDDHLEEELKELQHQVMEYKQDILELQGEQDQKNRRVEALEEELEELKETFGTRVQQATQQVNKQMEHAQQEYQLKHDAAKQENVSQQKTIRELQSAIQATEGELAQAKEKEQHMQELLQEFQLQVHTLQQQQEGLLRSQPMDTPEGLPVYASALLQQHQQTSFEHIALINSLNRHLLQGEQSLMAQEKQVTASILSNQQTEISRLQLFIKAHL